MESPHRVTLGSDRVPALRPERAREEEEAGQGRRTAAGRDAPEAEAGRGDPDPGS